MFSQINYLSLNPMCMNITFFRSGNYSYLIPVNKYTPVDVEISLEIK